MWLVLPCPPLAAVERADPPPQGRKPTRRRRGTGRPVPPWARRSSRPTHGPARDPGPRGVPVPGEGVRTRPRRAGCHRPPTANAQPTHRHRARPRPPGQGYSLAVPFPRGLLNDNEEIVLDLHPHWWFFAWPLLALLGAVAVGLWLFGGTDLAVLKVPAGILILVALAWFGWRYLRWVTTNFVVSTDRLIY